MSQHDSYRNGLILPILQALATAILSGLCAGFISALLQANQPGGIALAVGAAAGLLSWLSFRLALSVIIQAVYDASAGDPGALSWFSSTGLSWMQILDIRFNPRWVKQVESAVLDPAAVNLIMVLPT